MKKIISTVIALLVVVNVFINTEPAYAASSPPEIIGEAAVLIDAKTGEVLFHKNMNKQLYPASTTKIMTAILALEHLDLSNTMVIDAETPYTIGSRIYLLEGEKITTEQVLNALLIESANDAAVALGKAVAGDIPTFAKMMNEKAKELGAKHTHFTNANGLPDENHVTTAYDLAMMANYAMKKPEFRKIVTTYRYIIPKTNRQDTRYLYNTNRLLYDEVTKVPVNGVPRPAKYDGCTGIKTGFTDEAGGTLVASAKRGNTELLVVVLKSTSSGRFGDSIALLDYGFEHYKSVKALDKGSPLGTVKVKRGDVGKIDAALKEDAYVTLPLGETNKDIQTKIVLDKKVTAPIKLGQKVGTVEIYNGDKLIRKVDAIATSNVAEGGILSFLGISDEAAHKIVFVAEAIVLILILFLLMYVYLKRKQAQRRRHKRAMRLARSHAANNTAWKWSSEYNKHEDRYR